MLPLKIWVFRSVAWLSGVSGGSHVAKERISLI